MKTKPMPTVVQFILDDEPTPRDSMSIRINLDDPTVEEFKDVMAGFKKLQEIANERRKKQLPF